jgi:formate C-acetyltransferase
LDFEQNVTDRVKKLYEQAREAKPFLCVERARYWTESWKQTEGEPVEIRRAKALKNVFDKMSIYIFDGELIVGNVSSKPRGSVFAAEYSSTNMWKEFKDPQEAPNVRKYDHHDVAEEVQRELEEEIFPYWNERTTETEVLRLLDEDSIRYGIPSVSDFENLPCGPEVPMRHGAGHLCVNHKALLERGSIDIIEEAERRRDESSKGSSEWSFYEAVAITHKAFIDWAKRYAKLAREQAESEVRYERKQELLEIAKRCEKVPAYPAETFIEALQVIWFVQVVLFGLEQDTPAISLGRMDQYLYPYYKEDVASGRLNADQAQELIELFFIKTAHMGMLFDYATAKYYAGFSLTQTITVGGMKADGSDATNDITYMILEAERQVGLFQPELSARINKNSPQKYLMKIAEVNKLGHGKPKMFVDETAIPMMLSRGFTLEEARDYTIVGCVELSTTGSFNGWVNSAQFNLAKCLELALNGGTCMLTGDPIGVKTQAPETFQSMEELMEAFRQQVEHFADKVMKVLNTCIVVQGKVAPEIFTSSLMDGCMESGKDIMQGGAKHKAVGLNAVAVPDVGDSLAAIDYIVFREKKISMGELVEALRKNFAGEEQLQLYLTNRIPKYGNDNEFVDNWVRKVSQIWSSEIGKLRGPFGEHYNPGAFTVSSNVSYGEMTAALPSGRKAREPLANGGICACNGADKLGPTALLSSVARVDHLSCRNGTLLNMRLSPSVLKEERDIVKFTNLLRTYIMLGGYHIQFNVVSSSVLKKAQKEPSKYRNLLVRVAGYSAYFTELCKEVQEDLINRTVYEEV